MGLSEIAKGIAPSPTLKLNERALLLKQRGDPVIHLGIGEPKGKTPIDAVLAASASLGSGDIKYTPADGIPELKQAIVRYMEDNYQKTVDAKQVMVSSGAKAALYAILRTILNPQEEVIITVPYWVSYPEMVKLAFGVPIIVRPEDGRFEPKVSDIEQAVSKYTKAVIVNSPNNPSGAVYSEGFISDIVDFCERRGLYLIMDDIYHKIVFDDIVPPNPYKFAREQGENSRLIVINGISKLYGMTGFRIGWAVASKKIIEVATNCQMQTISCPSALLQVAAVGALLGMQSYVDALRRNLQNNRDVVVRELETISDVKVFKPQGTFYCVADFRAYSFDSTALSEFLLDKALVVTVPGKEFGLEGYLRLSFAGSTKEVIEGVQRIRWALDPSAPRDIYIGDRRVLRDWK